MARKTSIEAPKGYPGDSVMVMNYNRADRIESGVILDTESKWTDKVSVRHNYRVRLERKSAKGNLLFLHVGDDRIVRVNRRLDN